MSPAAGCRWCARVEADPDLLRAEAGFVVLSGRAEGEGLTLLVRAHRSTLAELEPGEMAAVLAGLTRVAAACRAVSGVERVVLEVPGPVANDGHFRVHLRWGASGLDVGPSPMVLERVAALLG